MICGACSPDCEMGTYKHTVPMPINGKVQSIDQCIAHIVAALNAGGIETVASCCGHGRMPGNIVLSDGRVLSISLDIGAAAGGKP